jgi:ABC-type phosphonate transport system ATPase subunit
MSNPIVEVRNLTKAYGKKVAVADLSFDVAPGEIFGVLGPTAPGSPPPSSASPACARPTAARSVSSASTRRLTPN